MKRTVLLLSFVLALFSGCATPSDSQSSAFVVIPGNTQLGQTDWVPTTVDIRDIEAKLGFLFLNPDGRISGISDAAPPYLLKDYVIRYTITGPKDSTFIVGEAVHKSRPEATTQLDPAQPSYDPKKVKGAFYFTFVYDVKIGMIREVLFSTP